MGRVLEDLFAKDSSMKTVGLIINPLAGLGGRVGLKGSDGVAELALSKGAIPQAENRTALALHNLLEQHCEVRWLTCSGAMGENLMAQMGFTIGALWEPTATSDRTSSKDTQAAALWMVDQNVDLILFAGGDGTARDLCEVIGNQVAVLGIPAGVKIHSPVYAKTPARAGTLAELYLKGKIRRTAETEVVDLDESAYREGVVHTRLYGYLQVPVHPNLLQSRKAPTPLNEQQAQRSIAQGFVDAMAPDVNYILGPGTTTQAVMDLLGIEGTLLGVDMVRNRKLTHLDVSEQQLLEMLEILEGEQGRAVLVLTPTGGQGYLLGRGNQQISPTVLKKIGRDHLQILCTKQKLAELKGMPLMMDTGDLEVDHLFKGYFKILNGYQECAIYKIDC